MTQAPAILAAATLLGAAFLLLKAMEQQGSGAGDVGTNDSTEGTIFDMNGIANQLTAAATPAPEGNPTRMSAAGLDALKVREGFSASPYPDHKGYSIGYGHLIKPGERLSYVSIQQATDILAADVAWAQDAVTASITAPISQAQFDALASFCFNVGAGAFARSTLVRRINQGDPAAADEFARWVFASGQVNGALVARRNSEQAQFESATA